VVIEVRLLGLRGNALEIILGVELEGSFFFEREASLARLAWHTVGATLRSWRKVRHLLKSLRVILRHIRRGWVCPWVHWLHWVHHRTVPRMSRVSMISRMSRELRVTVVRHWHSVGRIWHVWVTIEILRKRKSALVERIVVIWRRVHAWAWMSMWAISMITKACSSKTVFRRTMGSSARTNVILAAIRIRELR
jgi:hypothetical protein